jgi:ketosteroid isomerase-like protein/uncharacterized membrane protein
MITRASIAGHPVHALLVHLPVGLLSGTVGFDLLGTIMNAPELWVVAAYLLVAGSGAGALAAMPGIVDLIFISRAQPVVRRAVVRHAVVAGASLAVFLLSFWIRGGLRAQPSGLALGCELAACALLALAGRLGGSLVFEHGVGVTTDDNNRTAIALFERFSASDIPGALALLTDDVTWRVPGKPGESPAAGTYDKRRLQHPFEHMLTQLVDGLSMTVLSLVSDGDHVSVEAEGRGDLRNGRQYRQQYHFAFTLRDGKIATVREYYDTHHAFEVWMRP